jgi:long-subunit fatty acid transport protein
MKYDKHIIVVCAVLIVSFGSETANAQLVPNLGGQRAGISAFQFLKIGVGGRGVAMGESFTAVANDPSAIYWNPAGLVQFSDNAVIAAHTEYVVDIRHTFFGVVYHLTDDDAVAVSITSLYMDDMEITTETQPFGTGRFFTFGDVAAGLSYARRMTEQFSFGLTVKYVEETLDVLKMRSVLVDLGTYYWTGLGTTRFAVVITNFGADVAPTGIHTRPDGRVDSAFQSFSPPTMFKLGVAFDPITDEEQQLTTSVQLNHPNDNSEHFRIGLEYSWQKTFFVRGGIKRTIGQPLFSRDATSEEDFTLGVGIKVPLSFSTVDADYAFVNFNRLGSVHRIAIAFTF